MKPIRHDDEYAQSWTRLRRLGIMMEMLPRGLRWIVRPWYAWWFRRITDYENWVLSGVWDREEPDS